jgi:hypothetical protein
MLTIESCNDYDNDIEEDEEQGRMQRARNRKRG